MDNLDPPPDIRQPHQHLASPVGPIPRVLRALAAPQPWGWPL